MHLLHFGTFEEILYPYVKNGLKADDKIGSEASFMQLLLLSADEEGKTVNIVAPSMASRYKKGTRAIPGDVATLFHKARARDIVIEYLDDLVVPYINLGQKEQLIDKFTNIVYQDTTIDRDFKTSVLAESYPEELAAFLADLLIYSVSIDPTERDREYPVENYNLPMSNDWFTGREKELQEIADNFSGGCRIQILYGMGGMGKSQIAQKYAYDHYHSYSFMYWIDAHTIDSIVECYRAFLKEKQIAPADQTKEAICQAYTKYLDSHSDWMLIYDNCDYYTDAEYAEFTNLCLPKNCAVGNILITSRNKRSIGKAKRIEIGVLSDEDAVKFLLHRTWSIDSAGAEQLARRLGRFPLALEIAGAYIHATPGCDFETYLGYLAQETKILDQMVEVTDYNETIREILLLTIKRIKADRNNDALSLCIEDVLRLCLYGAPYNIDLRALAFLPLNELNHINIMGNCVTSEEQLRVVNNICADELKRSELARTLITYALMVEQPDGFLSQHELQQEILRDSVYLQDDWSHLLFVALSDFADTGNNIWLHYYQHEAYIVKHWEELARRNIIPPSAAKFLTLLHWKAQVSLLMEQFKARIADNPEISKEEFRARDYPIRQAVQEMLKAYEAVETESPSIDDLGDYMDRLLDAAAFYRVLGIYIPATGFILYALHALYQAFNRWGDDAVMFDSLRYGDGIDHKKGYFGRLLREIRQCLPPALLAGEKCHEYLAIYLRQLCELLEAYAETLHWDKTELEIFESIINAYIKGDPGMLPESAK